MSTGQQLQLLLARLLPLPGNLRMPPGAPGQRLQNAAFWLHNRQMTAYCFRCLDQPASNQP